MPTASQRIATRKIEGTVDPSDTVDFDPQDFAGFNCAKYVVCVTSPSARRIQEHVVVKTGADVSDQVYAKEGDTLAVSLNFAKVGSDVVLRAVNSEAFAVDVSLVRTTL